MAETIPATLLLSPRFRAAALLFMFIEGTAAILASGRRSAMLAVVASSAIGLTIILAAAIKRYGKSVLHCETLPVTIGSSFRGHIDIAFSKTADEEFWLVLRCTEAGDESSTTLWQDELAPGVHELTRTGASVRVPFAFDMPTAGKATSTAVRWALEITSRQFAARFSIPVAPAKSPPTVPDELVRPFGTVRDSLRRHGSAR